MSASTVIDKLRRDLLKLRRAAQRALRELGTIEDPAKLSDEDRRTLQCNEEHFRTVIAITRPTWIARAPLEELRGILTKLSGKAAN